MKRTASMTLSLAILLGLSACGNSNGPATPGVEPPIDSGSPSETYVGTHAGTRSDPYELGDTILLSAKDQQHDYTVEYTLCFDKVWTDTEIENAYPSYKMDGRFILGGTISVDQAEIDDGIPFTLRPTFITADLNEETAGFEGYK